MKTLEKCLDNSMFRGLKSTPYCSCDVFDVPFIVVYVYSSSADIETSIVQRLRYYTFTSLP